jgi:hypothetical protein
MAIPTRSVKLMKKGNIVKHMSIGAQLPSLATRATALTKELSIS